VVAVTASVVLLIGLMAGTTSAKKPGPQPTPTPTATPTPAPTPTPTPNSDNRTVYFGDPDTAANGTLAVTPVSAGGVFTFDVLARNDGSQNLTHAVLAFGDVAAPWPDGPSANGLPSGATILSATVENATCGAPSATGFSCEVGSLGAGAWVKATFVVQTPATPLGATDVWASFKVAENVNDQGANRNTFFAHDAIVVAAANSNAHSNFILGGPLTIATAGQPLVTGDKQVTTLEVPGAIGGLASVVETDGPTGCNPKCIGQTVSANVRDGAPLSPYLKWTLVIAQTDVNASKGGVIHTLDDGTQVVIANTKANACSASKPTDCIETFVVDKQAGTTTIVVRTPTNGAIRGFG
jgi:hypothetical protein